MNELKWAVLGTGVIANEMAQALHNMGRTLYGVCNRTYDKAVSFAEKILSQMKPAPTGCDEQASILLMNPSGQMATVALSMHSKQPKRAMISCEKAYIEIMEYPRADHAVIVDAETGKQTIIEAGRTSNALQYELEDMETAILTGNTAIMKLRESSDVMDIMTKLRSDWGLFYPEEIHS